MKKAIKCFVVMLSLLISSSSFAYTFPTPFNVRVQSQSTSLWSSWTPYYVTGGTYYEVWDVAIEQSAALNGKRFQVWYYDEGTEYEYAYMYENGDYDECIAGHWGAPTYDYIMSDYIDINWDDGQTIAYIVHDNNGTDIAIYLRVQLYTIGK